MCMFYSYFGMGTLIHYAGETVIRYWYVKSSMRPELKDGFKNKKMLYMCLGVPQILLLLQNLDALRLYVTNGQFPTLLYQACLDPWDDYSSEMFANNYALIQAFDFEACSLLSIVCNLFLYRFLDNHRKQKSGRLMGVYFFEKSLSFQGHS